MAITVKRKKFLFVDDEPVFLATIRQLFQEMSHGTWEILTAANHSQALGLLQKSRFDLIVLDLNLPVMDGLQFLRLLARTHPGQQVAFLTGSANEQKQRACLEGGASLFLEKVATPDGYAAIFATLDALAGSTAQEGFHGMMRRVGLQEVLQMECLGRKSSVLEISAQNLGGQVFISEGAIVHAQCGALLGEQAFYKLLSFRGGQFNLLPYTEPAQRTISGQYEFLLMEAARLVDERSQSPEGAAPSGDEELQTQPLAEELSPAPPGVALPQEIVQGPAPIEAAPEEPVLQTDATVPILVETPTDPPPTPGATEPPPHPAGLPPYLIPSPELKARIQEILLASDSGEVLYDWQCRSQEARAGLLDRINRQAAHLGGLLPVGQFQSLEIQTREERIVCLIEPQMRLFMRRTLELMPAPAPTA